eukprot:42729-Prymnesium_polylepis.1
MCGRAAVRSKSPVRETQARPSTSWGGERCGTQRTLPTPAGGAGGTGRGTPRSPGAPRTADARPFVVGASRWVWVVRVGIAAGSVPLVGRMRMHMYMLCVHVLCLHIVVSCVWGSSTAAAWRPGLAVPKIRDPNAPPPTPRGARSDRGVPHL